MRAHARAPYVVAPVTPAALAGRPAKADGLPEEEFGYSLPFEVDLGRAAVIAEGLRESGYPLCTADVVTAELVRPGRER